ncbi:MAG: glucoamylase family protein [Candidatus Dactylopiibacterium sp.]|nr:glucoamylase family protein [Candidatus Dactylopiibacterium sp.]
MRGLAGVKGFGSFEHFGFLDARRGTLEAPVRALLFGPARFARHGQSLAATHEVRSDGGAAVRFYPRLEENIAVLGAARRLLEQRSDEGLDVGPAGAWLLDNASLIDEQLHAVHKGLPKGFFRRLPVLRDEPLAGLPRIYGVAWAWVAHSDAGQNPALLETYLRAYQDERELTLAELGAFPTTLRVVLVENLRRLAERVATQQLARDAAHHWLDGARETRTLESLGAIEAVMRARGVVDSFLLQLDQRDEELPADEAAPLAAWITARLRDPASTLARQQAEATEDQQSIGNTLTTLRLIERQGWGGIFARSACSIRILTQNPVFAAEGEPTRRASLIAIEKLARRARLSESEVARRVVALAEAANGDAAGTAPGYWLQGEGRPALLAELGIAPRGWPRTAEGRHTLISLAYFVAIAGGVALVTAWIVERAMHGPTWLVVLAALLLMMPVSEGVVAVINRLISESVRPRVLPRLALPQGIPAGDGVLVVMPCMLGSAASIAALCDQLEQHFLANPERNAQFALLSDWADADQPFAKDDETALRAARDGIDRLNRRHARRLVGEAGEQAGHLRFLLLHREREWCETEGRYIGYERKRGKLEQLARVLVERQASPFVDLGLMSAIQADVRYLVTLDSDTDMPPGRLRELVGMASHPLNRPRLDASGHRIASGHAVIQPRVVTPLPDPDSVTLYHVVFSGACGIDPYSAASSEVYQDVFGEGSFSGKGIFDVAAMHAVLGGRLPAQQVLSHDLLEGAMLRCASASDVSFVEAAPQHPDVAASRLHRWTRGDWQLLPFVFAPARWDLSPIACWKMLDNLRRSLVMPASLALLVLAVATQVLPTGLTLMLLLTAFSAGPLLGAVAAFAPGRDDISRGLFFRHAFASLARALSGAIWHLVSLLQQALMYADAIVRALYRHTVSRRHLLQWTTAQAAQAAARTRLTGLLKQHWRVSAAACALFVLAWLGLRAGLPVDRAMAAGLCALWAASGFWIWLAARPRRPCRRAALGEEDRAWLFGLARDTWRFYERFVGEEDHYLPPDNVQLVPTRLVAHRTSPTNIGLYLASVAVARELGFIGRVAMAERIEQTLTTMEALPRHAGHLYNWYDTRTLEVLHPAYISSVDSGNLSGALLMLARACEAAAAESRDDATRAAVVLHALRAGEQGLQPIRTLLQSSAALQSLARLVVNPQPWPVAAADMPALRALVKAARKEFDTALVGHLEASHLESMALLQDHLGTLESMLRDGEADAALLRQKLLQLGERARALALAPDYGLLYDTQRDLLHIGLRVDGARLDANHYDLLASEARLTSLIAIAKGDVPPRHWSALGRPFFSRGRIVGLKSWSGSMFEYLMPSLLLDEPAGSVLQQVTQSAVDEQRREAEARGTPWGISESAIAAQDHTLAYQYGPQGVPTLALRRTPQDERVIAPYASVLALRVAPAAALANLRALERLSTRRTMGFIESLDYSPHRVSGGQRFTPVETHMAHHQAMSLLAMADLLCDGAPRRWAMSDPYLRAVSALLHERAPAEVPAMADSLPAAPPRRQRATHMAATVDPFAVGLQATQLLGNGRYTVMLRANGAGCSRWGRYNLTRWRDDPLRDLHGTFLYLQREPTARPVSLTAHPAPDSAARYGCRMQTDRVIHDAEWDDLVAHCTTWVSPEDDCEMRQVEIASTGRVAHELVLSFYAEASLAPQAADESHPAFSKLFVQAAWDEAEQALYLRRQPRLEGEEGVQAVFFLASSAGEVTSVTPCTDRARWLGRYGSVARVGGQGGAQPLEGGAGDLPGVAMNTGLDPVAVIRVKLRVAPGASVRLTFCAAAAESPAALGALVDKYRIGTHVQRASSMSHTMGAIRLREWHYDPDTWRAMLSLNTLLTAQTSRDVALARAMLQTGSPRCDKRSLWRHGISGDKPILLLALSEGIGVSLALTLKRALRALNETGVPVDLVVLNAEPASYLTPVHNQLQVLRDRYVAQTAERGVPELRPGFHILREHELSADERATLTMLARARFVADGRSLAIQMERLVDEATRERRRLDAGRVLTVAEALPEAVSPGPVRAPRGRFDAGTHHFRFDVSPHEHPSRPWVQILANPDFGCQISEAGGGYTWSGNSRMHQITEWSNDPLADPAGEHLLLQDLDRGAAYALGRSLSAQEVRRVEYGAGFARMTQTLDGLDVTLTWCVDAERTLKQVQITIGTRKGPRRLRLVSLLEWFMGSARRDRLSLVTRRRPLVVGEQGAGLPTPATTSLVLATQTEASGGFGDATAFVLLRPALQPNGSPRAGMMLALDDWTCDRREFFDEAGRLVLPQRLGRRSGAGLDACAGLGMLLTVDEGEPAEVTVLMGHAATATAAELLALEAWSVEPAQRLAAQREGWRALAGAVEVRTPDAAFDALMNHWLPYQTLACRMWARAGFYQAGGAFGYRDQLQDAMAFVDRAPEILARQIRVNAARQFPEGDVQHWWHEPGGAGVRTHFSDDRLWLPLALCLYLERTGDARLLDEQVPFLEGAEVPPGREDIYESPRVSAQQASLYEHAARAVDRSLASGAHGLPLFGTGDWNDGMNRVGHEGRGESVWLAWFLCAVIDAMVPLARTRGEEERAARWLQARAGWVGALEAAGWDGAWYRRGFFDDGSALGSAANAECRIDLIAQAWAVLAAAGSPERARQAMRSAWEALFDPQARVLRLLDPPLQHAHPSAGYIQAYPPGVRENGGQYNHGAVWGLMALAALGETERAWQVFTALSPAHRCEDEALARTYALEPYVMAGDIYSQAPWAGRGGWSWYTGSAGWLLRAGLETFCGLRCLPDALECTPALPPHWPGAKIRLRHAGHELALTLCAVPAALAQARAAQPRAIVLRAGERLALAGLAERVEVIVATGDARDAAVGMTQTVGTPGLV